MNIGRLAKHVASSGFAVRAMARVAIAAPAEDKRTSELSPVAPPVPALKYQFIPDPMEQRRGNAAIHYLQATMFLSPDTAQQDEQCMKALEAKDDATFVELARHLTERPALYDSLQLAGECEICDWQPAIRERGIAALLPHLSPLRQISRLLRYRTELAARDGRIDDALTSLRHTFTL